MLGSCPECGLVFERDEGSRLGSAMVNYAFVGLLLVAYLVPAIALTLPDPPLVPLLLGAAAVAVVPALVFFPFAKTIWAAIEVVFRGES